MRWVAGMGGKGGGIGGGGAVGGVFGYMTGKNDKFSKFVNLLIYCSLVLYDNSCFVLSFHLCLIGVLCLIEAHCF